MTNPTKTLETFLALQSEWAALNSLVSTSEPLNVKVIADGLRKVSALILQAADDLTEESPAVKEQRKRISELTRDIACAGGFDKLLSLLSKYDLPRFSDAPEVQLYALEIDLLAIGAQFYVEVPPVILPDDFLKKALNSLRND